MSFKSVSDLLEYLNLRLERENREYEFKQGMPWEKLQDSITKTAMAMANIRGGGRIIVGVSEKPSAIPSYSPDGMTHEDASTYNKDRISACINEFADPFVKLEVQSFFEDVRHFVVIKIFEFEDVPVVCKKDGSHGIYQGRMYYRTHRQAESTSKLTVSDMREILERAVDRGIIKQLGRVRSYGIAASKKSFEEERREVDNG